jgi:signal transduction histidine kinase
MTVSESLTQAHPDFPAIDRTGRGVGLYSLRHRLPLLIFALLAAIGGTFAWMASREVEQALRVSGTERAAVAATQVSDLLGQSLAARAAETRRIAATPEVRDAVQSGNLPAGSTVPAVLRDFLSRNQQATVWLYDANRRPIGPLTKATLGGSPPPALDAVTSSMPSEGISPLRVHEGRVSYFITAPVANQGEGTRPAGYMSIERSLRTSAGTGLLERLIGAGAVIKLGNVTGDVWTDLNAPVAAPPPSAPGQSARYMSNGQMRLGASSAISGTPWVAWAEISEASVLSPAHVLAKRMVPISLLITVLGALAVYVVCARVTKPLTAVAEAAQAVAAGDYSRRVDIARRDEIGGLGLAFNVMAARVAESHEALEARVQARTQELEAFSYSVSHDLRAPLRHISGFAALLQKSGSEYLTDQDRRYVQTIAEAAGRMSRLVDDLLGFSRMARAEMERTAIDCDALVREVVAEQMRDVEGREVDWVLKPLPSIRGDRAMLKVALTNLVSNAVKYSSTRERPRVEIGAMPAANGERILFVRDNGVGFDMQYADKLFGVFQRLHSAEEFEGTGIGLANVHRIVQRHGGRTWAEASVDGGATFYVAVPAEKVAH